MSNFLTLKRTENQALGIGRYAVDFLAGKFGPVDEVALRRVELFHLDSIACAVSAIACGTNAPSVLRAEALEYASEDPSRGAALLGSSSRVAPEKAVLANSSAAREWDANGTNFGFNPQLNHTAGEFGHNDFYPVAVAAAQLAGLDGSATLLAMLCLDEIRGRLAEVFALKNHKIDHVLHGAIASAAVYGAMLGASPEQIESAVGQVVAHYVPFRAIRAGKQLSDSKGASAAVSAEAAVMAMRRAMRGFVGPGDVLRNPQAVFCLFEPPEDEHSSPFDLVLATDGAEFAVMGMHFKLGLYEHQSAGAIGGLMDLLARHPQVLEDEEQLRQVEITIYEPAFSIIGDPAKRDPRTRQSADHSMVYIIATLLRKAYQSRTSGWRELMLVPEDYADESLQNPQTRRIMEKIVFRHGGREYDDRYPDGIPTTLQLDHAQLGRLTSGLVMYPEGHARCTSGNLDSLLKHKFNRLASLGVDNVDALYKRFTNVGERSAEEIATWFDFPLREN